MDKGVGRIFEGLWERRMDVGLLVLRVGFGLTFTYFHGWRKLVGGPETWTNYGDVMEHLGINFGHTVFGFLAAFSESIGGILIALGLFFRPMCLLLGFTMFMAAFSHFASGRGNPAHAMKNFFVLMGVFIVGPGKYSIDAVLASWWRNRHKVNPAPEKTPR
ncbi:MAG: DoxX family protein [Fidelibacterota bacterium]